MASAVALLAAGQARRFGSDKLAAPFRDRMLGLHAADTLARVAFDRRWVIVADLAHPCIPEWQAAGFEPVFNPGSARGMGTSVALAANLATEAGADRLVIALADMPLVPASHFAELLERGQGPDALLATSDGQASMPPAVFGSDHFARLAQAQGDAGARTMLAEAQLLTVAAEWLADIDDPATLALLQARPASTL